MGWLKSLSRKAKTLASLSSLEKRLLLQSMILLPLVALSLHSVGLKLTQKWLAQLPHQPNPPSSTDQQVWLTMQMVRVAARYQHLWANCLKRSLVLWALLRCQGIASNLRIGVQRQDEQFLAHAWVEYNNMVLNDSQDVQLRYHPFQHSFERFCK